MSKKSRAWLAATAFAGLTFSLMHAGTVVAQPPGRGPGGPGSPGFGGPPNVAQMFSRMDKNNDGKLTKDEVPEPVWSRLSSTDANRDGAVTKDEAARGMSDRRPDSVRPGGARSDASPNDRSHEDQSRTRGPRPPMAQPRGDTSREPEHSSRDASSERGRPAPPHSRSRPDDMRSDRPDSAHRAPSSFGPDAFFDRLDRNSDGNLSRDEFKAVAELHRGLSSRGPQGFGSSGRPSAPPVAMRGPDMRGGGPPWARSDRGGSHGPQRFQGGPPWTRSGHGPSFNSKFAGPPWAHADQQRCQSHDDKKRGDHGRKPNKKQESNRRSSHRDGPVHHARPQHDKPTGHGAHGRNSHDRDRTRDSRRGPRHHAGANTQQPDSELTANDSQSASPSDNSLATLPL